MTYFPILIFGSTVDEETGAIIIDQILQPFFEKLSEMAKPMVLKYFPSRRLVFLIEVRDEGGILTCCHTDPDNVLEVLNLDDADLEAGRMPSPDFLTVIGRFRFKIIDNEFTIGRDAKGTQAIGLILGQIASVMT